MVTDALLINGVSLPYHLLDKGIEVAKLKGNRIKCVFIYENDEENLNVKVPDDVEISKADFSDTNAERNLGNLVRHNSDFSRVYFARQNIDLNTVVLRNPSLEELVQAVEDAEKIYLDPETFKYPDEFAYINFSYDDLEAQLTGRLEWCSSPDASKNNLP